jgi:hypothetical protein
VKQVILPIGPQYAGKSRFCKAIAHAFPNLVYVSRDDILVKMFGADWGYISPWQYFNALEQMYNVAFQALKMQDVTIILDTWSETPIERQNFVGEVKANGAENVDAWFFRTAKNLFPVVPKEDATGGRLSA